MTAESIPHIPVRTALVDVDETITHTTGAGAGDDFLGALCHLVAQHHGVDAHRAEAIVRDTFDPEEEPLLDSHLQSLGVGFDAYWRELMGRLAACVQPYDDAVQMIRTLRDRGVPMYPATTNSGLACRAKLATAGLAGPTGPTCFGDLLGGSEVHPNGKRGPAFFAALLEKIGRDAQDVLVVGDDEVADLAYAQAAGIQHVVIVRRDQDEPWFRRQDGAIFVRRLTIVPEMLVEQ